MDSIDWLDTQGTPEAHAARDELTSLRAFKAACESQGVAAIVHEWRNDGPCGLNDRAGVDVNLLVDLPAGSTLYSHPDPEAAQLRIRVKELEQKWLGEQATNLRIEAELEELNAELATRDQQVAEACAKAAEAETKVARECLAGFGDNAVSHCQVAFAIRSGEWKKHMKGVE